MAKKHDVAGVPGSDPTLPKVPLTLGGKKYYLCFNWNALAKAEELTGMNLISCFDTSKITASSLRALLLSAMLKHQPSLTLEEVGDAIGIADMKPATEALMECWVQSMPKPDPEKDENPLQPEA